MNVKAIVRQAGLFCLHHPLLTLVPAQALLLFWNIGLLTMWTDELWTLRTVTLPVGQILDVVRADIHPPLYFLLEHFWVQLPLPGDPIERIRAMSAICALAATFLLDRLWLTKLNPLRRFTVLLLWCLSPAVLLYGRMGRSYLLQTAVALLAVAAARRALRNPGWTTMLGSAASSVAVLYTHYLPGIALTGATGVVLAIQVLRRRQVWSIGRLAAWAAVIVVGYLPWLLQLRRALLNWRVDPNPAGAYKLTGSFLLEQGLKIGYAFTSFSIGETFPFWALAALPLVAIALCASLRRVWRTTRSVAAVVALAAVFGYVGAARWVSYPFMPARLFWLLPFFLMWIALSPGLRPWARSGLVALLVAVNLASIVSYYRRDNFLNNGYAVRLDKIAATVRAGNDPERTLLMVDAYNTDAHVFLHYVGDERIPRVLVGPSTNAETARRIQDAKPRHFWSLRCTHDISPGGLNRQLEALACGSAPRRIRFYQPYASWERTLMVWARMPDPPVYFYQLTECFPGQATVGGGAD